MREVTCMYNLGLYDFKQPHDVYRAEINFSLFPDKIYQHFHSLIFYIVEKERILYVDGKLIKCYLFGG